MKISKRQLRKIIREYEVPHESRAFLEDHPDFQRGQDDAMMGYPAMDGATPEYMEGYYDGSELVSPQLKESRHKAPNYAVGYNITRRQLKRIIREEVVNLSYDLDMVSNHKDIPLACDNPEEVEANEDSWAGGNNVQNQIDHAKAAGAEDTTQGIEILVVTESQIRKMIRVILEESDAADIVGARRVDYRDEDDEEINPYGTGNYEAEPSDLDEPGLWHS